jgi:hypothetical protein
MSHDIPETTTPVAYSPAGTDPAPDVPVYVVEADLPASDYSAPDPSASDASTSDVAKEKAADVSQGAADAGKHVAGVAKDQAAGVASETTKQAKDLLAQTRGELQGQAATQQDRIAAGIRSLSSELGSMASNSDQSGTATDLVRQVSARAEDVAGWLEARDPGALVQEVSDFARRRPGAFLAIAVGAGLLAGRLTRGAVDAARDDDSDSSSPSAPTSAYVGTGTPATSVDPAYDSQFAGTGTFETGTLETEPSWEAQVRP